MKATRRHELQHNVLDAELGQILGFFRRHGAKLSYGLLAVAVVVLGWTLWHRHAVSKQVDIQNRYEQLRVLAARPGAKPEDLAAGFRELAEQDTVPWVAADALVSLGHMHATQAVLNDDPQARRKAQAEARSAYQQVVQQFGGHPAIAAAARVGLGKLAEDEQKFDEAKKQYQAVLDMPNIGGYSVRREAQAALNQVNSYGSEPRLATSLPGWLAARQAEEAKKAQDTQPASAPAESQEE
jgi:predicted negative regulator of RcsB-dependent stress response